MSFFLHSGLRVYFGYESGKMFKKSSLPSDGSPTMLLFDAFYAGLLVGLHTGRMADQKSLEKQYFIDHYPNEFEPAREYIAGLLVEAELRRLDGTKQCSERQFEREIAKLLDADEPSRLSQNGIEALNSYAAGGFELIREALKPNPTSVQDFLLRFHEYWDKKVAQS